MLNRLIVGVDALRAGLWPVPIGMIILALPIFAAVHWLDRTVIDGDGLPPWWLHSGSGDDARNLLSTLVTALITMSSIVFSITVATLSIAAGQFGSRLIRAYMTDVRTKLSLGIFMTTIVYCLLALRAVGKDMPPEQVPHLVVTVGLALGLGCVLTLLFFLHVIARSAVADEVIRRVAKELEESLGELPPLDEPPVEEDAGQALPAGFEAGSAILRAREEGYVQAVEQDELVGLAARHGLLIRLEFRSGAFICRDGWLARVHPAEALTADLADAIQDRILIGEQRTPVQDLEFSIRHLVDVALRALSPSLNDPNTAMVVIDHLRAALSELMGKRLPPVIHRDEAGQPRLVGKRTGYDDILAAALHQIRQAAAAHPDVIVTLLRGIGRMAEHVRLPEQSDALRQQARLIAAAGMREAAEPRDRTDIGDALATAEHKLDQVLPTPDGLRCR